MNIPAREAGSGLVNVIVETVAGSRNKYKYDEASGLFKLHKRLPLGARFPFDFGFIPSTRADDGDPVDVMILDEEPTFMGCLVTVRLIGILDAKQTEKGRTIRNDRLIGVPRTAKIRPDARTLGDLPARMLDQIEHFFTSYNLAEGRRFEVIGRRGPRAAEQRVDQGIRAYQESPPARQ